MPLLNQFYLVVMPNLFAYTNYRTFLKDVYEEKKAANPQFSYRLFARLAGFSSPNYLKLIILAQRNLSPEGIAKVAKAVKLKVREAQFFDALVHFNQSNDREEKTEYYEKLLHFKAFKDIKAIESCSYEYLSKWYHAVIRELVLLESFREDPAWIGRKLRGLATEAEIRDSIRLLLALGFFIRDKSRRLRQADRNLATDTEVADLSVSNFHDNMISLAADAIDNTQPEGRDISSVTVAIDRDTFEEAKRRVQDFRRELNVLLSRCQKPDAVYQINFQIFPLTEVPWSKK
jgi:uncharacterized protein (TIGR02147 family)